MLLSGFFIMVQGALRFPYMIVLEDALNVYAINEPIESAAWDTKSRISGCPITTIIINVLLFVFSDIPIYRRSNDFLIYYFPSHLLLSQRIYHLEYIIAQTHLTIPTFWT